MRSLPVYHDIISTSLRGCTGIGLAETAEEADLHADAELSLNVPDKFRVRKDTRNRPETQPLQRPVWDKKRQFIVKLQGRTHVLREI